MPLPDEFLQELKSRCDIGDIASAYVSLRRRGKNLVGLCPFHGEKTPSFNIYPENGSFYCFGCGAGGDVITFVRRIENLDYMEAVRFLAQRAGISVPESGYDDSMARVRTRLLEINREAARYFYNMLYSSEGKNALEYLRNRGLTEATIRHFGLGYAPNSRFGLVNHLKAKGYMPDELVQSNIAFMSRSNTPVDRFFDRVMYPIIDLRGNVIAFGGRTLGDGKPKYLNTSGTMVFNKSNNLFALNFAKNSGQNSLILAEGYMDVIAMHQAGFTNAVATLGTALTTEQASLMRNYTGEVIIAYDADEAGQKATARAIPILRDTGLLVKVLTITGGKDPDEYIRSFGEQGPARFKQLLEQTSNDIEYRLQKIKANTNMETAEGRVAYLTAAAALLSTIDSRIEQEIYAGRLSEEIGVERSSIMLQVDKYKKKQGRENAAKRIKAIMRDTTSQQDSINPERAKNLRAANAEEALIALILTNPDTARHISRILPPDKFCTDFNRRVYEALIGRIMAGKAASLTELSGEFSMEETGRIAKILARFGHDGLLQPESADSYIQAILQEKEKLKTEDAASAAPEDIRDYLERLKKQKTGGQ